MLRGQQEGRALRLNYYELNKRLVGVRGARPVRKPPIASFVELASTPFVPEWLVELESPSGTKMRIQLKGMAAPDVALLRGLFWGTEP